PSRHGARLGARGSARERDRPAEAVAAGERAQDLCASGAEVAVPGRVLGERRRRERGRLVWEPLLTGDLPGAATWSAPGRDRLPPIEPANRRDRPDGVERDLVVPCTAARVEDRVREREEELDRRVEIVLERACRVALQHLLCEEVPVPRRKLGMRPV